MKEYLVKGFVLNDERFKSGRSMNYFDELQQRIREIRLSEKSFYQKIKDIYTPVLTTTLKMRKPFNFSKSYKTNRFGRSVSKLLQYEQSLKEIEADIKRLKDN